MQGKTTLAAVAAAMMAGPWGTPSAQENPNRHAAFNRQAIVRESRRHLTKKGPGRGGHKGKLSPRGDRRYAVIAGQRRNIRKLLGTR